MVNLKADEKKLNPEQKQAVKYGSGPLLIIAGAGTGKTTVITERIKHLITSDQAKPAEILALTFTEKAAREMEERVDMAMPYGYTSMWISTFHSFCDRILRSEAIHIGLNPAYQLLTEADANLLLRKNLFVLDLDYFRPLGNPTKFITAMLQHFSRLKDEDCSPSQYIEWVKKKSNNSSEEKFLEIKKYQELARAYKAYEELKIKEGKMDFGDLISNTLLLFRQRKNILTRYQNQFKVILVDEFQDTNIAQYELIKLLAPNNNHPNLTVVGDDNQSIYKFRGAAVSNILSFMKDYSHAKQVILNRNYRSFQYILDSAYKLITYNDPDTLEAKLGISKKLKSIRSSMENLRVEHIHADRVENEADLVAKEIKKLAVYSLQLAEESKKSYNWRDFAILVRANNHADAFTRAFTRHDIPYQFLGPGQLFRQPEIKELISYLRVLANFEDNACLYQVLAMDHFVISARDLASLLNFTKKYNLCLFEAIEVVVGEQRLDNIIMPRIAESTRQKLLEIVKMIHRHLKLVKKDTAGQILFYFLEDSGMLKNILEYKTALDERRAGNITKFFNKLKTYEVEHEDASIEAVLDWILLSMELGESPLATDIDWTENDAVNILTVHSSKGLEFPVVFLVNLVAERFPTRERREQIPIPDELIKEILPVGDYHEQEERRLFYVGMTRTRDRLYLTSADYYGEGKREKKISPFVHETLGDKYQTQTLLLQHQMSLLDWKKPAEIKPISQTKFNVSYLSYSQIETFRLCPLHYKLRYILNITSPPSPPLSFGSSMHKVMKEFYQQVMLKKPVNQNQLIDLLKKHWIREGYTSKKYEQAMWKRGENYLVNFLQKEFNSQTKVLLLEQPFIVPIGHHDGGFLKIGGRIDRVDDLGNGKIEILDYKTGRMPSKRKIDTDLQLSMYALAATAVPEAPFNKQPEQVVLSLYFFDDQQKVSTTRTKEQLEKEKDKIRQIAVEIEQSDFKCSGHQLCQSCEYQMFCGYE